MDRLTEQAAKRELIALPGWKLAGGNRYIYRRFEFTSYSEAITFVNRVAAIAEHRNHHPEMTVTFRAVGVAFTTHDAGGLTMADFESALEVQGLFA